jgi:hypothetical protein
MTSCTECSRLRISLGVYVLGAIEPTERSELEAHLATCGRCRDELASLAGLPALLSRVTEEQLAQLGPPQEELFESVLGQANRETRGRRRRNVVLLAAAAIALVVATGLGVGAVTHERPAPPVASGTPQPGPTLIRSDRATGVRAQVSMQAKQWGTAFDVVISGAPPGAECQLIAVDRNGRSDVAGAWEVPYATRKESAEYFGSSMITRDELASIEVRTLEGKRLISIPV